MTRYEVEVSINATNRASREFKKLDDDIKRVRSSSKQTATGFDGFSNSVNDISNRIGGLTSTVTTLAGAFGAIEVARVGYEMAKAGEAAVNTANRFRDLVGGSHAASAALKTLRETTNGMVADTGLMAGASRLLQMGIAQSVDEAAKLVEIAIALKQPSEDAATAIENLSLMIANASYLRLDSLGLSAGRVRERVNELKEAGYDLQEAFTKAFIEEAADSMDRLSDSTEQAVTAMSRLETRFANLKGSVDQAAFSLGEFVATYFEEFAVMAAFPLAAPTLSTGIFLEEAERSRRAQLDLMERSQRAATEETRAILARDQRAAQAALEQERRAEESLALAEERAQLTTEFSRQETIVEQEREQERQAHIEATYRAQERFYRLQSAAAEREARSFAFSTVREFDALDEQFKRIYDRGVINEDFYNPRNLTALSGVIDQYDIVLTRAEALADRGLIDDESLSAIRSSANDANRLFQSAESQARAFQNVNLSTLLGEVSGGATTDIGLQVSVDFVEEQMATEFTKALERLTGERTVLTDYMEDSLVPLIQSVTESFGPEEGALFAYNLRAALQAGLEAGLSPEQVKEMIQNTLGFDFAFDDPMTVTVPAMVTWSDVIADGIPTIIDPETGQELDRNGFLALVEERLNLDEGTITADPNKAIKYSLANTAITITDVANATGMAEEQLAQLFFNDPNNRTVDMTEPLSINLHSVGWGQILDMTGLTTQALLAQLPDEAVDIINGQIFIRPGTYQIAPLAPVQPEPLGPFTPQVPYLGYGMPTTGPAPTSADPLAQTATNAITQLGELQTYWTQMATSATTVQQKSAETDFSAMETGMEQVANHSQDAFTNLTKLVETEWVATVALDFVILDSTKWGQLPGFSGAVRDIMERSTRDNGGVAPGSGR